FLVCAVSTLVGVVPTLLVLIADDPRVFLPCIFLAVALLFTSNAPFHAILLESVPFNVRAMAVALNIVIIHAFGDAIPRAAVGGAFETRVRAVGRARRTQRDGARGGNPRSAGGAAHEPL